MTTLEQVKAWNFLMSQVNKIQDYDLRVATKEEFKRKAMKDWGWIPSGTSATESEDVSLDELEPWEKEFIQDVQDSIEFNVDFMKDKRKEIEIEAKRRMLDFIKNGGLLIDIPENVRTPHIEALYHEMWQYYAQEFEIPEHLLNTPTPPNNNQDPFGGKVPTVEEMTEWLKQGGFYLNLPRGVRNSKTFEIYKQALGNL